MAATLTPDAQLTYYSFPITKTEEADDGSGDLIVWGKATDGSLDSDLQIVDPEWSAKALQEWYDTGGNVRVQHQAQRDPAGKGIDIVTSGDGTFVKSRVVEPVAVKLVKAGVLQDYSVGIMNPDIRRGDPRFKHLDPMGKAVNGVITGREDGMSKIGELSLVDRGSNFGTRFQMVKAAADGTPEWTGELTAPDDVLAKVATPAKANGKTVTVELPKNMSLSVKPSDLAKLATFKQKLAAQTTVPAPGPVAAKVAEPDAAKAASADDAELDALKAAEITVYKRDIDTATRRRLHEQGRALDNLSYPIETHEDAENAVTLALSGHGNVSAAKNLIRRVARKEGWQDILDRLKGGKGKKKADKSASAKPDVTKCMKCDGSGMTDGKPCPECKKGRKAARKAAAAQERAVRKALAAPAAEKKHKVKVMCPNCGAKQNVKHVHCPECGKPLPRSAPPVVKNHDFACLGCGKDLDKGERHCPGCGRENPGYLPEADHKIPANKAAKERVSKRKKAKGKKDGKGGAFGGHQAPPFGAKDEPDGKPKAEKRKGKGRSPATGVTGHEGTTMPLPAHREPDGAPVEAFENDAHLEDGDQEMKAAMRHQSLAAKGISRDEALLHDLTCPAFDVASVAKAFPHATLSATDDGLWQAKALDSAASAPLREAGQAMALWQHAVTLKGADPEVLADLRIEAHKAFRDANPGPGSFPTPGHVTPGQFRRPYIHEGHAAPSPMHEGARTFGVPEGQPSAADYTRDYLTAGHAADSPQNDTPRHMPQPASSEPGKPDRVYYRGTMRDNARQAMTAMHDHISRVFPDVCPMSPEMGDTQKPAPQVPDAVGGPAPRAKKAATAKQRKALARKRRRLERKVLKGSVSVNQARKRLGLKAKARKPAAVVKAVAPSAPVVTPLDPQALTEAMKAATAPLLERIAAQDKTLRKQRKAIDAIAAQPDTSQAPLRGVALTKSSAPPAGVLTAAQSAELAKAAQLRMLYKEFREQPDPDAREAAYRAYTDLLGINPMTPNT